MLVAVAALVTSCGGSGGGPRDGASPTTTIDPLAAPVVDACGHELGDLTSTVWAVDPSSGSIRWTASVPLASPYLLRDPSGDPRVSLVLRPVEAVLDREHGDVVATPAAGVHEVLVDPAGATGAGEAALLVDGERQPATIEADGMSITTAAGATGQATVALTATVAATAAPAWRVELGAADAVAGLSPPVLFGDTVVVVTSPPAPACP